MTHYQITYYCNDKAVTCYTSTVVGVDGNDAEAAAVVFDDLPRMPGQIASAIINKMYPH